MKEKRNILFYMIGIVVVVAMIAGSYFIGIEVGKQKRESENNNSNSNKDTNSNSNSSNVKEPEKEVDSKTLQFLLDILGIKEQEKSDENLAIFFSGKNGVISELSLEDKKYLIFLYAFSKNMLGEVTGKEFPLCEAGSGSCQSLTQENFEKIKKLYGIKESLTEIFVPENIYKNQGLFYYRGFVSLDIKLENIKAIYSDKDIIVTMDFMEMLDGETTSTKKMTYTFKLDKENNYYLYSVRNN